jgi:hypothetical protein
MRRVAIGCILVALVAAPALSQSRARAAAPVPLHLYIDDRPVDFSSHVTGEDMPALVVEGQPMLPVRLFSEALNDHLDLHLWDWKIVQIGRRDDSTPLAFKLGEKVAYRETTGPDGSKAQAIELPIAPRLIDSHLYVPALPTLGELGHSAKWDAQSRTLRVMTGE